MKLEHEKIVLSMKIVCFWGISLLSLPLIVVSLRYFYPEVKLTFSYTISFLTLSLALVYGFYQRKIPQIIVYKTEDITGSILLDYYSLLIPNFLFCIGWILDLSPLQYKFPYNMNTFLGFTVITYPLLFSLLFLLKRKSDNDAYITLKMANDIFINYLAENESFRKNRFYAEKFSFYFNRSIENIDQKFTNGVKIGDLEHQKAFPIKKVISDNLLIYIMYGKQSEINSLKYNLNCICKLNSIENQINYLEIAKPIFKIYVDIKDFLIKRNYRIRIRTTFRIFNLTLYNVSMTLFALLLVLIYINDKGIEFFNTVYSSIQSTFPKDVTIEIIVAIIPLLGTLITNLYRNKDK